MMHYFLFDMDGTLVDTEGVGPATLVQLFIEKHVGLTSEDQAFFTGIWRAKDTSMTQDECIELLARKYLPDESEGFLARFYSAYLTNIQRAKPLHGVDDFLQRVHAHPEIKCAMVTSSSLEQAEAVVERNNWQGIFEVFVTRHDKAAHKPSPEPWLLAMQKLQAQPEYCTVFEDSEVGVRSGLAAGCKVVAVSIGSSTPDELNGAAQIYKSFEEVNLENLLK